MKTPRAPPLPSPLRLLRLTEHHRTVGHLEARRFCLSVFVPLTAHCHPVNPPKSHFLGRFGGVRNASLRRTFCCVVHQKRDFKAHPAASTTLLVGSFQLAADSRLSTHSPSTYSRPRLALDSRNSRSGYSLCGQRGLEFDCGLRKGPFDGRNQTIHRV